MRSNIGVILVLLGRIEDAISYLHRAILLDPESQTALETAAKSKPGPENPGRD